jgi:hypothetical protein
VSSGTGVGVVVTASRALSKKSMTQVSLTWHNLEV